MTRIEKQLEKARLKYKKLLEEKAEQKRLKALERKIPKKRGRKPLDEKIIEKAKEMARDKFLPDVALSLGVALRSLYNHGISRAKLNKEIKEIEPKSVEKYQNKYQNKKN